MPARLPRVAVFAAAVLAGFAAAAAGLQDSKTLALQIALDRAGFSSNAADGQWGRKTASALACWAAANGRSVPADVEAAHQAVVKSGERLFRYDTVTAEELASLVTIPVEPAEKAKLERLGYESIREMYAERGHVTEVTLARLNPGVDFRAVKAGTRILIPDFPSVEADLKAGEQAVRRGRVQAARLKVSLSRYEIVAYDGNGHPLALFPCSIAKDKAKVPKGTLKVTTLAPRPNYTYTPDSVPPGKKASRHILSEGPNCPVGVVWIGLSLAGYGIHGTPTPETIGRAESHGCFRLANWNVARLFAICNAGVTVEIEE